MSAIAAIFEKAGARLMARQRWRVGGVVTYARRVKNVFGSDLVTYWQLNELSGATALDSSGNGRVGAYSNVTLGQSVAPGVICPAFNGANSIVNVYSASFNAGFNNQTGTLILWLGVDAVPTWTDTVLRRIAVIGANASNRIVVDKLGDGTLNVYYRAGGTVSGRISEVQSYTGVKAVALTWDKPGDAVKMYIDGVQIGATVTGLGVWSGALDSTLCVLGAEDTTPAAAHKGHIAQVVIAARAASAPEIAALSVNP